MKKLSLFLLILLEIQFLQISYGAGGANIPCKSLRSIYQSFQTPRAVEDPQIRELMKRGYDQLRRDIYNASSQANKLKAQENLSHLRRMVKDLSKPQNLAELKTLNVDVESLLAGIILSDIGKSPRTMKVIMEMSKRAGELGWQKNDFFKAFLLHERYGLYMVESVGKKLGLSNEKIKKIVATIKNHNGPGSDGSWWKINFEKVVGKPYGLPESAEGFIHTIYDRIDQAQLIIVKGQNGKPTLVGGPKKILTDVLSGEKAPPFATAIQESLISNMKNTLNQINDLKLLAETKNEWNQIYNSAFIQNKLKDLKLTEEYYRHIKFESDLSYVVVNGKKINSVQELIDTLAIIAP